MLLPEDKSSSQQFSLSNTSSDILSSQLDLKLNNTVNNPITYKNSQISTQSHDLVFIDSASVQNYQTLISAIDPLAEIIFLDAKRDGVQQITDALAQHQGISSIHIVSHGSSGSLQLGSGVLNKNNLENYQDSLLGWANSLTADADILLYGCDVAQGEQGLEFIQDISKLTDADVAASNDLTGSAALGGNWQLESTVGRIETSSLFQSVSNFNSVLLINLTSDQEINGDTNYINEEIVVSGDRKLKIDGSVNINNLQIRGNGDNIADKLTLIADDNVNIEGFLGSGGLPNLVIQADKITVKNNVIVSTRQINGTDYLTANSIGNSGNLEFGAPIINVGNGAKILTQVENGSTYTAGDITLNARDDSALITPVIRVRYAYTDITLTGATLKGKNILLETNSNAANTFDGDSVAGTFEPAIDFLGSISFLGGGALSKAESTVTIGQGSNIDASSVTLKSTAEAEAIVNTLSSEIAIAYAQTSPKAKVIVEDNVTINTAGDLTIDSRADSVLYASARQLLIPIDAQAASDITLALGFSDIEATSSIAGNNTNINVGGRLDVKARMDKEHRVLSTAAAYNDGSVALSAAVSLYDSNVTATIGGNITVGGDINIEAQSNTPKNDTQADADVGSGLVGKIITNLAPLKAIGNFYKAKGLNLLDARSGATGAFKLGGAFAYADDTNNTTANIANSAYVVSKTGNLKVNSSLSFVPEIAAISVVDSEKVTPSSSGNNSNNSVSGAITIGRFNNNSSAFIGDNTIVDAKKSLSVTAETRVPYDLQWFQLTGAADIIEKLNTNFGLQNGLFSSWAQSAAVGNKFAGAGSGNYFELNNTTNAIIHENAKINQQETYRSEEQHVKIQAKTDVETVDLSGNADILFFGTESAKGVGGSYLQTVYNNNTTALIEKGASVYGETLFVRGDTAQRQISFTQSGGKAEEAAVNASVSIATVNNHTISQIDDGATIVTGDGFIQIDKDFRQPFGQDNLQNGFQKLLYPDDAATFNPSTDVNGDDETITFNKYPTRSPITFSPKFDVDGATDTITVGSELGLETGDAIIYDVPSAILLPVSGLSDGQLYYVIVDSKNPKKIKLAQTKADAQDGKAIHIEPLEPQYGPPYLQPQYIFPVLKTGDVFTYNTSGNNPVGGLLNNETYYVIATEDPKKIQLATTKADAFAGNVINLNPTLATGKEHYFVAKERDLLDVEVEQYILGLDSNKDGKLTIDDDGILAVENNAYKTNLNQLVIAEDEVQLFKFVGGIAVADNVGVGASLGFNDITRDTKALIGNKGTESDDAGSLTAGGKVKIVALNNGLIGSGSLAAAVTGPETPKVPEVSLPSVGVEAPSEEAGKAKWGISISGDVSINTITDTTEAYIRNAKIDNAVGFDISAINDTDITAVAGAAAISVGGKSSAGIAGSYSQNTINSKTKAYIDNSVVTMSGELRLDAQVSGSMVTVTAGGSGAARTSGISIAVAGSVSVNQIDSDTSAYINNSSVTAGSIKIESTDESSIIGVAGALSYGGTAGVGASIGVNLINNQTQAYINGSDITTTGNVDVAAKFNADIVAVSAAIAASTASSGGAASFSVSVNKITGAGTNAYIAGKKLNGLNIGSDLSLDVADNSYILAAAGNATFSGGNAGLGVSFAKNDIAHNLQAYIDNTSITSVNNVNLEAISLALIEAVTIGGTLVANIPTGKTPESKLAGAFAGAGAGSGNTIRNKTKAEIRNKANVKASGNVTLSAKDESKIRADAGGVAIAIAVGQQLSGATTIGASLAKNDIQNAVTANIDDAIVNSTGGGLDLSATSQAKIEALTLAGSISAAFGQTTLSASGAGTSSDNTINNTIEASIKNQSDVNVTGAVTLFAKDTSSIDAAAGAAAIAVAGGQAGSIGVSVGASLATNNIGNTLKVSIDDSKVTTSGIASLTVDSAAKINALTITGVAAVAGGASGGITASGAGSQSTNAIANIIEASIKNSSQVTVNGGTLNLSATDNSAIKADAGSGALSIAGGAGGGISVAVSASLAKNTIGTDIKNNSVKAFIDTSKVFASSDINLSATTTAKIDALAVGVALSVTGGAGGGLAGSGAGASSTNTIKNAVEALINNSNNANNVSTTNGGIILSADDSSKITADVGGFGLAGAGGGGGSGTVSVGAGVAENTIANKVKATLDNSFVTANKDVALNATANETVKALSLAGSLSVAIGGGSVARAGAGVQANNRINNAIAAAIQNDSRVTGASVKLNAKDSSDISSKTVGSSIAVAGGIGAGGLTVTASIADNEIGNTVQARISHSTVTASGGVELAANSTAQIEALSVAVTASAAIGGGGSLSGGGASANNSITNTISSVIDDSTVTATNSVKLEAIDSATINSDVGSGALSIGLIGASVGTSLAKNAIDNTVTAFINGSNVTSTNGDVTVSADSTSSIKALAVATAASISFGGSGAGGKADSTLSNDVTAYINSTTITAKGNVKVQADSNAAINSQAKAGSGGLVAVGVMLADAQVTGSTQAYLGTGTQIVKVNNLEVLATSANTATTQVVTGSGGIVGVRESKATVTITPKISAYIANNVSAQNIAHDVTVRANSQLAEGDAIGKSFGGGVVDIGVPVAKVNASPEVTSYIGSNSSIIAGGDVTVEAIAPKVDTTPPSDIIQPANVNTNADTIKFDFKLEDGDAVVYDAQGNSAINGLVSGREYNVLVANANDNTIRLGSSFNAASIDSSKDIIKFEGPHNFETGDRVKYSSSSNPIVGGLDQSQTYYVRKIDDTTIKLARTLAEATAPLAGFWTTAVNKDTDTININNHGFSNEQAVTYRSPEPVKFSSGLVDVNVTTQDGEVVPQTNEQGNSVEVNNNNILIKNHGLVTGDEVVYRSTGAVIGNLVNDGRYFVIKVNDNELKLATTLDNAIDDPNVAGDDRLAIEISRNGVDPSVTHSLVRVSDLPLGGLESGVTYYVIKQDDNNFKLAATPNGSAIDIDTAGLTGLHFIGTEGIDLTAAAGTQSIYMNLNSQPQGEHRLLGSGSVPLSLIKPSSGDGKSSVTVQGGAGGVVEVSVPKGELTASPKVTAYVAAKLINAGGDVTIASSSNANITGSGDNRAGGVVKVGITKVTTTLNNTSKAFVGVEDSSGNISANGVQIIAGGNFKLTADTVNTNKASTVAYGGGVIGVITGEATANTTNTTKTTVGDSASITADTVKIAATVSKLDNTVNSKAKGGGLFGASTARGQGNVTSNVDVVIEGGANTNTTIVGNYGVDIQALTNGVTIANNKNSLFIGIGPSREPGDITQSFNTNIDADAGATVTAGSRDNATTPLTKKSGINRLALLVEAANSDSSGGLKSGNVTWDADVVITPGPSPDLEVDANGNITKAVNVTVNGGQKSGAIAGNISVDDINNDGAGEVLFEANGGVINGSNSTFDFSDTLRKVKISNASTKQLTINKIDVVNSTSSPTVYLRGGKDKVGLQFDIRRIVEPTLIDIENSKSSDILFNDLIDNPIGKTLIKTEGNILSSGSQAIVRTNIFDAQAGGNIGTTTNRINVELVESADRPEQVFADAQGNVALNLKGRLRNDAVTNFTVNVDSIKAGNNIDLLLQDSLKDSETGTAINGVTVKVPGDDNFSGVFTNHFRPDDDSVPSPTLDPGVILDPNAEVIAATLYRFESRDANGNFIGNPGLVAGGSIIVNAATKTALNPTINIQGIVDILGTGSVSVETDGSINLSEKTGDFRAGLVKSYFNNVTLTAPDSIVDALNDAASDVTGVNITLTSQTGGIGSSSNFLEIDSSNPNRGALKATAGQDIFITEISGDLNVDKVISTGNTTLTTSNGSILDFNQDSNSNIDAVNIDLNALGGSIGTSTEDLEINTSTTGRLVAKADGGTTADGNIYLTETSTALNVLLAEAVDGIVRLTVNETSARGEDLKLLANGQTSTGTNISKGRIAASGSVKLRVGDNVTTTDNSEIVAGRTVTIQGDYLNLDAAVGTNMDLRGTITPGSGVDDKTEIFGNSDNDTFTFNQTFLGGQTNVYGGATATSGVDDGEDQFIVNQLQSMTTSRNGKRDTLNLDGQADTDTYTINTTGSQGAYRDYIINVLDKGAKNDGADTLTINGADSSANDAIDDIFLMRRMNFIPGETADTPASVSLLHGTLAQTQTASSLASDRPQQVQRINYDANINGSLNVNGLGGNDYFASDDNSAVTNLDGGAGNDQFQIGQLFGTERDTAIGNLAASDVFDTVRTTRGYLSRGNSFATTVKGGTGEDAFTVYSNQAQLNLQGNDGNDEFVIRAFVLADENSNPLVGDVSTSGNTQVNTGAGDDRVQYNVNAPVAIDGGTGFDKIVALGTEFADTFIISEQGISGAGINTTFNNAEVVEVDGLEGDDEFFVISTAPGVATRIIGGLGSDIVNIASDVTTKNLVTDHLLNKIRGPVEVIGGTTNADRSLKVAVILPKESNAPLFAIAAQPDENEQIDTLNIFDDSSQEDKVGVLTATNLSGFNMAADLTFSGTTAFGEPNVFKGGITYGDATTGKTTFEVLNLLMGSGNDKLTIASTLSTTAKHGGITTVHGGGNRYLTDAVTGTFITDNTGQKIVGGDTIIINGGGGTNSPLVVYGDTSQDGAWYAGSPTAVESLDLGLKPFDQAGTASDRFKFPIANSFALAGNDTIDARNLFKNIPVGQLPSVGLTIYSGAGNDTIYGSQAGDHIAGGSGNDKIEGQQGNDHIYGDSGFNVNPITRELTVVNVNTSTNSSRDSLTAGDDTIDGGIGENIIVGDYGIITQTSGTKRILTTSNVIQVETANPAAGGNDTITTGGDRDIILGGNGSDNINAGDGNNIAIGDSGKVTIAAGKVNRIETTDSNLGGNDTITTGSGEDIVLGGFGSDNLTTGASNDVVLGDNGYISYVEIDNDPTNIDRITTTNAKDGGNDTVNSGAGNDIVLGGVGDDQINAGDGNDLIFGDNGKVEGSVNANLLPLSTLTKPFTFTSIDTTNTNASANPLGGNDIIYAGVGKDIALGGQGNDTVYGEAGDDDIIGGHNVAGGNDGNDILDGGTGNDAIAGDNASILRRGDALSPRIRTLKGQVIYDGNGNAQVNPNAQNNPNGVEERQIVLFDHSDTPSANIFGNDNIAGGAQADVIFGQLGDDTIQGDGSVSINTTSASVEDFAGVGTDGDDYIEGNGGSDRIFGNLGQDDIIGGSSNLFSLTTPSQRPDGADTIFGGAGTDIARNDLGDTSANGHAQDADYILGDNGNILRLIGSNGQFLTFTYDFYGTLKVIPRAIELLDYTQGGASSDPGTGDILHGESGDDVIHGMSGNDVIFGEGQDDDIYGGTGSDRIYGGAGEDGILGDDGKIFTSRNGLTETLYGINTVNVQTQISLPGPFTGAWIFITGRLNKTVDLAAVSIGGNDVIYGGLGDDFLHGGAGDDGISGAEAQTAFYNSNPVTNTNPLGYDPVTRKLAAYDANNPLKKINNFFLNFDATDSSGNKMNDGKDRIFGDLGNDWLVGGTQNDRLFGGMGDDVINADDNHDTAGGLNNNSDTPQFADADFAFGGGGLDVLVGNTGGDRLFDWSGEFNSYWVPFSPFGEPTVFRKPSPYVQQFLLDLGKESGADRTLSEPNGELGLVTQKDPQWQDQNGSPRDPQGNNSNGVRDTQGAPEDDRSTAISLTGGGR
ncbi:DUF4347 domain-containing protein [Desmonostoc muscorum LEGE 12446]|uniref:DUF4347 domain-containing protein n=1 Tax=Desmonostoc muscorum LEGE 12446 TaxID=1828758 RepID=A0A8J6ZI37_DESMC|nr:DUF4347 domain-containing protein [Desmonostoc muscorum]MCF2147132.1 DUF4347 domain-containing protein [Desmonostoc muscorum LEGE 12446]